MSSTSDARTPGRIITFYSYKGGTGRSMALANVACLLARGVRGQIGQSATPDQRVLVIDWVLEAPGLHRYFGPFLADSSNAKCDDYDRRCPGLMDLFIELEKAVQGRSSPGTDEPVDVITSILE